jgi:hypothetical protein
MIGSVGGARDLERLALDLPVGVARAAIRPSR